MFFQPLFERIMVDHTRQIQGLLEVLCIGVKYSQACYVKLPIANLVCQTTLTPSHTCYDTLPWLHRIPAMIHYLDSIAYLLWHSTLTPSQTGYDKLQAEKDRHYRPWICESPFKLYQARCDGCPAVHWRGYQFVAGKESSCKLGVSVQVEAIWGYWYK